MKTANSDKPTAAKKSTKKFKLCLSRSNAVLTTSQKEMIRKLFARIKPMVHVCQYCDKNISNEHLRRLASHFISCKKAPDAEKEAFVSLSKDDDPGERFALKEDEPAPISNGAAFVPEEVYGDVDFDRLSASIAEPAVEVCASDFISALACSDFLPDDLFGSSDDGSDDFADIDSLAGVSSYHIL